MNNCVSPRLLLTTVFQPYGVTDPYAGSVGMQMELFNNQITREQGVHSPRAGFWTFPLYFLAENTRVPATVLDFPRWNDFVRELRNGYTHVGISFIQANVYKARRMAEYIRQHHPDIRIILGGYGTALPDVRDIVPCDEICTGEGIRWLRRHFQEDVTAPVRHPVLYGVAERHLYGLSSPARDSAVIFPGLGCDKSCFFCATSAKFQHRYVPILPTGDDIFRACREAEMKLGVSRFAVIDENFLARPERLRQLLELMERHSKPYCFSVFSSADAIQALGIDFLVRLGVVSVWLGIESPHASFPKLRGTDAKELVRVLQDHGITVISSSILFMEHHDRRTIEEDIEWAINVESDFHQFMQLTALPGTPLYARYHRQNRLLPDFPHTELTGQNRLNFLHPHFRPEEASEITRLAFRRKFLAHGPGILNSMDTALRGYAKAAQDSQSRKTGGLVWNAAALRYERGPAPADDPFMELRVNELRKRARLFRPILSAARAFAPNRAARNKAARVADSFRRTFGKPSLKDRFLSAAFVCSAALESIRIRTRSILGLGELVRQPPVRRIRNAAMLTNSEPSPHRHRRTTPHVLEMPPPHAVTVPHLADRPKANA